MSLRRKLAGAKAKSNGALFEALFKAACLLRGVAITRMPDGCIQVSQHKIIRVKTPFDWIISLGQKVALIDTKSLSGTLFPASKIHRHQLLEMMKHKDLITGYVVWLRSHDRVYFIPSVVLWESFNSRKGIRITDTQVKDLGKSQSPDIRFIFGDAPCQTTQR